MRHAPLHSAAARAVPHRQDRIDSSGAWWSGTKPASQQQREQQQQQPYVIGSSAGRGDTAPNSPPVSDAAIDQLADVLQSARGALVLTGAGCSTESGVPDYRGPAGAYTVSSFKPMTHQQFMASEENRARYWARSFAGWHKFSSVRPNSAHDGIARLQHAGWARALITQNVDRLHQKAGSPSALELHGTTHEVVCLDCGRLSCRHEFQELLAALNPDAAAAAAALAAAQDAQDDMQRLLRAGTAAAVHPSLREAPSSSSSSSSSSSLGSAARLVHNPDGDAQVVVETPDGEAAVVQQRPDGDVELADAGRGFRVPPCPACGGILKPHVVFFGDGIPAARAQAAMDLASNCRSMVVVGSSLAVWSAFRLAKAAAENGAKLVIVTAGPTRADELAAVKLEARAGEVMARLAAHPSLQVPPVY
ncbi:NAD-dependent deacylase SRT2 [Chlorella sorokiniana]|uniref:NAD-dependent deacylase SRT2 n=1 Tax=Chlorella sorokiniana TaxID=3076 RepID=A0A2P6TX41_CHLSO|nr:NAD-dependent deacylase SRT2 [Chlorella sorokiniana]|eukprot:PRW58627.1 NAD-dependent deacylase SRT2 [Chlorella sorokiniana]